MITNVLPPFYGSHACMDYELIFVRRTGNFFESINVKKLKKAKKPKAQVLGIAPLNMRSMCQRRFTIVEVVIDRHWL